MNKKFNREIENSIRNRRLFIGGSMVLDSDFDIKNYLIDVQKQFELEKINFNTKKSLEPIKINAYGLITEKNNSNFYTINYNNDSNFERKRNIIPIKSFVKQKKPLAALNNLLSLSKDNLFNSNFSNSKRSSTIDTDLSIQQKLVEANNSIKSTKRKIEKIIKKNRENTKSSNSIFRNSKDMFISNEPRFNVNKEIKEIQKREKSSIHRNIRRENSKIHNFKRNFKTKEDYENAYNNYKDYYSNNIYTVAFDKRHENEVFEPIRILNNYKIQKQLHINPDDKDIYDFNSQNKELTIKSALLKLMTLENNKLYKNYKLHENKLLNSKKIIENNEANFQEYKESQKKACKQLDLLYLKIQKKYKDLIDQNLNSKSEIKLIEDEIRRILHQIEHLRIYGQFVNKVLGGDTSRFENRIFPEQKYDYEIDIQELSRKVINKFKCFYENINQEKFVVENTFIEEPEKMWFKFKEMESIMARDLYNKEKLKGEIKK